MPPAEQIGAGVLTDLHGQREQIVRIGGRVRCSLLCLVAQC
jgi:hypothetical protein